MKTLKVIHVAKRKAHSVVCGKKFIQELRQLGDFEILEDGNELDETSLIEKFQDFDIILTGWGSIKVPETLAERPGKLKYICNYSGEIRPYISRAFIEHGIPVTNWGNSPGLGVAEGALTLLLVVLKCLIPQRTHIISGNWELKSSDAKGSIVGLKIGVFGLGAIGKSFVEIVKPLQPHLSAFDPYLEVWPEAVERKDSLDELFNEADAIVITAGRNDETIHAVNAERLSKLRDKGIIINVARGEIIDQAALFKELEKGRLRAGHDVLDTDGSDWLPPEHPARHWDNLVLSAHKIATSPWNSLRKNQDELSDLQELCLANISRYLKSEPLEGTFDLLRYDRST